MWLHSCPSFRPQDIHVDTEPTRNPPRQVSVIVGEVRRHIRRSRRRARRSRSHHSPVIRRHHGERVIMRPVRMAGPGQVVSQPRVRRETPHGTAQRLLFVVHAEVERAAIRIISARKASPAQRKLYELG